MNLHSGHSPTTAPTQTHLRANTTPAIDKGSAFGLTADQHGLTRPVEIPTSPNSTAAGVDGADMGAIDIQPILTQAPAPPVKTKTCKKK